MNTDLKKADSLLTKLRNLLNEQLWLIFLLAPLLIIAALVGPQLQSNRKPTLIASNSSAMLTLSIEVSSAELASIVAKPLSELLVMEVYFDHKKKSRSNARQLSLDLAEGFRNEAYNQSLANHVTSDDFVADPSKDNIDG